jgi:hypothetical protein
VDQSQRIVKLTGWACTLLCIAITGMSSGCTFIGVDNPPLRRSIDWGPRQAVPTCVYLDEGVSKEDADNLLGWWNGREGDWYNLEFVPVSYEPLTRDGSDFFFTQISSKLEDVKRPDRCVKQMWFVSRNFLDALYGGASSFFGLPEVMGWTDDETRSKAWVYANMTPDLNQFVMWPGMATRHEMYHLVGCDHYDLTMGNCYESIQKFKTWEREYLATGSTVNFAKAEQLSPATEKDAEETQEQLNQVSVYRNQAEGDFDSPREKSSAVAAATVTGPSVAAPVSPATTDQGSPTLSGATAATPRT